MTKRPRRNHSPAFKANVALVALKGEKTLSEIAEQFDVHSNLITTWRAQLFEGAAGVFGVDAAVGREPTVDVKELHAKIGELARHTCFYGALRSETIASRRRQSSGVTLTTIPALMPRA